jgi:subtilisin family serine protease
MQCSIRVLDEYADPLSGKAYIQFIDWEGEDQQLEVEIFDDGELTIDHEDIQSVRLVVVVPDKPRFWTVHATGLDETIICPTIDAVGNSWWHILLGDALGDDNRGSNIRIGVVDVGFIPDSSLHHIEFLDQQSNNPQASLAHYRWNHGEAVCRILSDLDAPESCAPIAPGSGLVFASASFLASTYNDAGFVFPIADASPADYLDPARVSAAIYELVFSFEVNLINLSLGTFELDQHAGAGVAEAIEAASEAGVTVLCAAGNSFVEGAAFPASLPSCIGVGAVGKVDWGPEGSVVQYYAQTYPHGGLGDLDGAEVYFWSESAYGSGVDVLGPGVGILIAREGEVSFDLSGTSFASPIVTGLLAVELSRNATYLSLPRDMSRAEYARRCLQGVARRVGISSSFEGSGIVTLGAAAFSLAAEPDSADTGPQ